MPDTPPAAMLQNAERFKAAGCISSRDSTDDRFDLSECTMQWREAAGFHQNRTSRRLGQCRIRRRRHATQQQAACRAGRRDRARLGARPQPETACALSERDIVPTCCRFWRAGLWHGWFRMAGIDRNQILLCVLLATASAVRATRSHYADQFRSRQLSGEALKRVRVPE